MRAVSALAERPSTLRSILTQRDRACISLAQEAFRPPDPSTQWGCSNLTFMGKRWYLERTILSKRTSRSKTLPVFVNSPMWRIGSPARNLGMIGGRNKNPISLFCSVRFHHASSNFPKSIGCRLWFVGYTRCDTRKQRRS